MLDKVGSAAMPSIISAEATSLQIWEPSSWIPLVRSLTPRTRIVEVPAALVTRLTEGSVRVPPDSSGPVDEYETWSDGTPVATNNEPVETDPVYLALTTALDAAISECQGSVCPKAGTSCPFDASWASLNRNTQCSSASDVLTLIAASERAAVSLVQAPRIALRQWADIDTRREVRAFVRDGALIGLCPRKSERGERADDAVDALTSAIEEWIRTNVHPRVSNHFGSRYVVDVYAAASGNRLWIIDFAPWGAPTDAILFDWGELARAPWMEAPNGGHPQFRSADEGQAIRPAEEMYFGLPLELRNADAGAALAEAARAIVAREQQQDE